MSSGSVCTIDELNGSFSGRPPSGAGRRMARELATRRRRSAPRGRDEPEPAVITPSALPIHPTPHFSFPRLLLHPCAQLPSFRSTESLRHRHSQLQLALSHPFATRTASPSSQQLPVSPIARCSSLVSHRSAQHLAGDPPLAPLPWPRRLRPPLAVIACGIGSPWSRDTRPSLSWSRCSFHRYLAVVQRHRSAMAAAVVTSVDVRAGQVVQTMRLVE